MIQLAEVKQQIKKLRELKGYSQQQMANLLGNGFSLRNYQDIENDSSKDVSFTQLQKIAEVLEMTVSGLVGFDEKVIFSNCKVENQSTGINYGVFTINTVEKLFERIIDEKDKRIDILENQVRILQSLVKPQN
jgi:transcriptional regulator with XRE-family HTH domain